MRRIKIHSGKPGKKAKPLHKGYIAKSSLKLVKVGKELKGLDMCYHIGETHPDVISGISLKKISIHGKQQVINWIHQKKIYILNEG